MHFFYFFFFIPKRRGWKRLFKKKIWGLLVVFDGSTQSCFVAPWKKKVWHVNNNNNIALENIYRNEGMFRHAQAPFVGVAFSATVHVISFSSISPTKWDWLTGHKKKQTDEIALHCPWRIDRFFVFQRSLCLFSYCGSRIARLRDGSTRALS